MVRQIVLDTETTGFDPNSGDRLVEVAALEIEDFVPTGRSFHRYIDPCRDMPAGAEKVHGLSTAFLRGKPKFHEPDICDALLDGARRVADDAGGQSTTGRAVCAASMYAPQMRAG